MLRFVRMRFALLAVLVLFSAFHFGCAARPSVQVAQQVVPEIIVHPKLYAKLYFGHPLNTYNTPLEKQLLEAVEKAFPNWDIENPNQKRTQEGVARWRVKTGNSMDYFLKELLPVCCRGGIFLPMRDGKWTSGVWKEAQFLSALGYPIWKIDANGVIAPLKADEMESLSVEDTRKYLRDEKGNYRPY